MQYCSKEHFYSTYRMVFNVARMTAPKLPKRVFLMRHAQSTCNEIIRNPSTWMTFNFWTNGFDPGEDHRDARLNSEGERQIKAVRDLLPKTILDECQLFVCSPLSRTCQTAIGVTNDHRHGKQIVAHPAIREVARSTCDLGRPVAELRKEFGDVVNFDLLSKDGGKQDWWRAEGAPEAPRFYNEEPAEIVTARVQEFLRWLAARDETNIFVFSHAYTLQELTKMPKFGNCGVVEMTLEYKDNSNQNDFELKLPGVSMWTTDEQEKFMQGPPSPRPKSQRNASS
jgi:broad specificity phosphatase PhoE